MLEHVFPYYRFGLPNLHFGRDYAIGREGLCDLDVDVSEYLPGFQPINCSSVVKVGLRLPISAFAS